MAEISAEYKAICDNLSAETDLKSFWVQYKQVHNRSYTAEEDVARFERFSSNIASIVAHNEKYKAGQVTYKQGVNNFTDMYDEEMKKYTGCRTSHTN